MGNREDFDKRLEEIKAIPDEEIVASIAIPVDIFAQEAENLYKFCLPYKEDFSKLGVDWTLVAEIPERVGALRQAESIWMVEWRASRQAGQKWREENPGAFKLREELVAAFKYAYQDNPNVMLRLKNIISGSKAYAARIQGLNDLSHLGKEHPAELMAMNFDLALLDKAAEYSDQMSDLYSAASAEENYSEAKKVRDRAYTFLKTAVDKLKKAGQYLFRDDKKKRKQFNITYGVRRAKNTYPESEGDETETEEL